MHDPATDDDHEIGARVRVVAQTINGIAHGLAGPMQAMTNLLFSMRQTQTSSQAVQSLGEHHEILADELQRLLVLARAHKPAPRASFSVEHLMKLALAPFSDRERDRIAMDGSGPDVMIEAERWAEAVHELVRNALEHAHSDSRVALAIKTSAGSVTTRVEGGDPDRWPTPVLRQAIDPFVTTKPRALGIGLATAFAFSDQRGGQLELSTASGTSVVVLDLPVGASL